MASLSNPLPISTLPSCILYILVVSSFHLVSCYDSDDPVKDLSSTVNQPLLSEAIKRQDHTTRRASSTGSSSSTSAVFEIAADHVETICINNTRGLTTLLSANTLLIGSFKQLNDKSTICAPYLEYFVFEKSQFIPLVDVGREWENIGWRVPLLKKQESKILDITVDNNINTDIVISSLPTPPLVVEGGLQVPARRLKVPGISLSLWDHEIETMVLSYVSKKWSDLVTGSTKIAGAVLIEHFNERSDGLSSKMAQVLLSPASDGTIHLQMHTVEYYQDSKRRRLLQSGAPPPDYGDYYYYNGYWYNPQAVGCTRVCILRNPRPANCNRSSSAWPGCAYYCYCQ